MSEPIILTERERAVFAELVSHLMGEAHNRDTERAWRIGEVLRAWLRDMEDPPTESASPPRVPGPSAQFAKVGVQSGPGQPIEALDAIRAAMIAVERVGADPRLTDAVNFLQHAQMRIQHFQSGAYLEPLNVVISAAEIRRLRAESESRYRAGIEAAAQYCIEGDVLLPDQAKAMVRALADKPPAALKETKQCE